MNKNKKSDTVVLKEKGLNTFIKQGIRQALERALSAELVVIHCGTLTENGYMINGDVYTKESALDKILGDYSWYKD